MEYIFIHFELRKVTDLAHDARVPLLFYMRMNHRIVTVQNVQKFRVERELNTALV